MLEGLDLVEVGTVPTVEPVMSIQLQTCLFKWGKLVRSLSWSLGGVFSVDSALNDPGQDANWVVQGQTHVVGASRGPWGHALGTGMLKGGDQVLHTYKNQCYQCPWTIQDNGDKQNNGDTLDNNVPRETAERISFFLPAIQHKNTNMRQL